MLVELQAYNSPPLWFSAVTLHIYVQNSQHSPEGNATSDFFQEAMQTSNLEENIGKIKHCLPLLTVLMQVKKEFVENMPKEDNLLRLQIQTALPAILGTGDVLSGVCVFPSSTDIKSGYWQVKMELEVREMAAFICCLGPLQFKVIYQESSKHPAKGRLSGEWSCCALETRSWLSTC